MTPKKILITGIAGFIGFSLAKELSKRFKDATIIGIDNLNDYYSVNLKQDRLKELEKFPNISFIKEDITNFEFLQNFAKENPDINLIFHLAAQAGVRFSVDQPFKYINYNINGQVAIMEFTKLLPNLEKIIYASSSSIYGSHKSAPFKESLTLEKPLSLYAATKQADELICASYSRLLDIPMIGLRFFTAYGEYGRPDMAIYKISKAIKTNQIVKLVGEGKVSRDFTYIDDVVDGIIKTIDYTVPKDDLGFQNEIFNLGYGKSINLNELTQIISQNLNIAAKIEYVKIHETDMQTTLSDIAKAKNLLNYQPKTDIKTGIKNFINWFEEYYNFS